MVDRGPLDFGGLGNERDFPVPMPSSGGSRHRSAATGNAKSHRPVRRGKPVPIVTPGGDLAKNLFAVDGADATEGAVRVRMRHGVSPVRFAAARIAWKARSITTALRAGRPVALTGWDALLVDMTGGQ